MLTKMNSSYSGAVVEIYRRVRTGRGHFSTWMMSLRKHMRELKGRNVYEPEDHCAGLFTMKIHLLDHFCEDLDKVGGLIFLHASAYGQFNLVLNRMYWRTFMRRGNRMEETICFFHSTSFEGRSSEIF